MQLVMKAVKYKAILGLVFAATIGLLLAPTANASLGNAPDDYFGVSTTETALGGRLGGDTNFIQAVVNIINILLGLLGLVAVIIILTGGFKWMTAGGSEDKVAEARKLIISGIIGLAIILSAWAIAKFVIRSLQEATGSLPTP